MLVSNGVDEEDPAAKCTLVTGVAFIQDVVAKTMDARMPEFGAPPLPQGQGPPRPHQLLSTSETQNTLKWMPGNCPGPF